MRGERVLVFGAAKLLSGSAARAPAHAYQLDTVNLVGCAQEGGVSQMPYPANVYFGVPDRTNGRPFPHGGTVVCNSQTFGDPAPGQAKSCWYAPRIDARGGADNDRSYDDDGPRRDFDRDGRYHDRLPARRSYDDEYGPPRRRYRDDRDDD